MSGHIFISYRRADTSAWARLIRDRLSQHFSESKIFMDVDAIEGGEDFDKAIEKSLGSCDVLIAVIGKRWLALKPKRRWFQVTAPTDYVCLEIATALRRGIRVVPALVDGALMPQSRALPDDLKLFVRRQSLVISNDRFSGDFERLLKSVTSALGESATEKKERAKKENDYGRKHGYGGPNHPDRYPVRYPIVSKRWAPLAQHCGRCPRRIGIRYPH